MIILKLTQEEMKHIKLQKNINKTISYQKCSPLKS